MTPNSCASGDINMRIENEKDKSKSFSTDNTGIKPVVSLSEDMCVNIDNTLLDLNGDNFNRIT